MKQTSLNLNWTVFFFFFYSTPFWEVLHMRVLGEVTTICKDVEWCTYVFGATGGHITFVAEFKPMASDHRSLLCTWCTILQIWCQQAVGPSISLEVRLKNEVQHEANQLSLCLDSIAVENNVFRTFSWIPWVISGVQENGQYHAFQVFFEHLCTYKFLQLLN